MKIETQPYSKFSPCEPVKEDLLGSIGRTQQTQTLITQAGFIKCPHCLNGVAKQVVDCKDLVWVCIMCGWEKPTREPEHKTYGSREAGKYDTKRY